ncbi:MAG: hypothetical protein C0483_02750 [Pirellula sp.]|nr:hypothetical protein [Pirellula sp.]
MIFRFARVALAYFHAISRERSGPRLLLPCVAWCGLALCVVAGCRKQEQITTEIEPHLTGMFEPQREPASAPGRLVGVLLNHADETWFFKVLGPDDAVRRQVSQIKGFLVGLKFDGNTPKWKLPDGWREQRDNPNRFATLLLDDSTPPLELAVSKFPGGQDVAANINRWRGQLGLPPQPADEAKLSIVELKTAAGPAQYVELSGTYTPEAAAMPPFAGGARPDGKPGVGPGVGPVRDEAKNEPLPAGHPPVGPMPGGQAPAGKAAPKTASAGPVQYVAPADWASVPPSQFNLAAFNVSEGAEKLRITISDAQGDLLSNINRWRGQELSLPPIDADQLETAVTKMKVGGRDASFVELIGSANPGPQQAIFVVVVPQASGSSWFLKLKGDAPLAQRRREEFARFLASLKFAD